MPIPFRDLGQEVHPGVAGYLRFVDEPDHKGIRGALFVMSIRGEPVEFCFARVDVYSGVLWRTGQSKRRAIASLTKALFQGANQAPDAVLALAEETPPEVFSEDLEVHVPLCLVTKSDPGAVALSDKSERISDSLVLVWVNSIPEPEGLGRKTIDFLNSRRLLLEPFERAALGLQEAFDL